ncbi:MAG: winged helix-turn-helix domain-containing protein [Chloroflexi bacterium]|nr:MAG: winged helix-turn-helix domain-containing protein [Chloroflexota bacterium]
MTSIRTLTRQDVRRLAISRQHLDGEKRPSLLSIIRDLGCVQLDPISAVERTQYLVLWSRLRQNFNRDEFEKLLWEDKQLFEYWAHVASIVLTEEFPVHSWFMRKKAAASDPRWMESVPDTKPLQEQIVAELSKNGAVFSRDIDSQLVDPAMAASRWWSGRYVSRVLDYLWTRGLVSVVGRKGKQRMWGMADTWMPDWTPRDEWDDAQVTCFALQKAVRALGVATPQQIKLHYTRHRYPGLKTAVSQLTTEGILEPIKIAENGEFLKGDWYLHAADAPLLESIQSGNWTPKTTLLSPFDNLICDRDRIELLFDFYFRIEIYVPKAKRKYGYYVLPILHGDKLIGRIDPKFERKTGTLHVYNVYAEENAPDDVACVGEIGRSVTDLAQFLGAKVIEWGNVPKKWSKLLEHSL